MFTPAPPLPRPSPFVLHRPPLLPSPQPPLRRRLPILNMSSSTAPTHIQQEPPDSAVSPASLEILGGARHSLLYDSGRLPLKPYKPFPIIGWNRHLETIFASLFRSVPEVRLRRECLRTPDDGAVALDWISGDDRTLPSNAPVLVLLPGLTGGSGDSYVRHMLVRGRSKGWRVVVFNSRGCADSPVTTPKFFSASHTGDLRLVVNHVSARYPKSNIYAVGWSIGANVLVRYLGEESKSCPVTGAVSLCNPFNLVIADEDFRKGFNNIYDKALASALCKIYYKNALLFEGIGGDYNIQMAANAKSVRVFDEGLSRVTFGYKSVDDYYSKSSSSVSIKDVRTPLLCIQAANDPFAPSRAIPREEIEENPCCMLIITPQGGHLGWVAGDEAPFGAPWTDTLVMDFLEQLERDRAEIGEGDLLGGSGQSPPPIQYTYNNILAEAKKGRANRKGKSTSRSGIGEGEEEEEEEAHAMSKGG